LVEEQPFYKHYKKATEYRLKYFDYKLNEAGPFRLVMLFVIGFALVSFISGIAIYGVEIFRKRVENHCDLNEISLDDKTIMIPATKADYEFGDFYEISFAINGGGQCKANFKEK
jgi:hypothetical protein